MWRKKLDDILDIYKNTNLKHPFELVDKFSCRVPIKSTAEISSILLYFGTYQKVCRGRLLIKARFGGKSEVEYSLDMSDLQDNVPIKLTLDSPVTTDKFIDLYFTALYEKEDKIAIWINQGGICAVVEGKTKIEYKLKNTPKFSIVTPVYKTKLKFLKAAVKTVQDQHYDNWELLLIDDCSNQVRITDYLKSLKKDKRIKVITNSENVGIAKATNIGINKASGDFIAFLDHDDLLERDALVKIAEYINRYPEIDLVYTDEDKVSEDGVFYGPFYKPDWNYNMLLSHMYTCHLSAYRSIILKEMGGIREGYDGSQDYDLVLRFIEKTKRIGHVPEVLYHWRSCEGSTALGIQNKPKARINAVRALSEHVARSGRKARVFAGPFQGHYKVDYLITMEPKVSIIIPFKDKVDYLEGLLYTMRFTDYKNYEILLVDNGSKEKRTKDFLKSIDNEKIKVLGYKKPFNFSAINNFAVSSKECTGDLLLFLNNDMEVMHPEWLSELVKPFIEKSVKVVGGKLLYLNHQIQHAGIFVGVNGVAGVCHKFMYDNFSGYFSRPHIAQEITAVTGACMMVERNTFERLKGFDEDFPGAFNDIDFCLRVRKEGHSIVYTPYCRMYHLESMSRGLDDMHDPEFQKAIHKMEERWDIKKFEDPYYNPNLPLSCEGTRWV